MEVRREIRKPERKLHLGQWAGDDHRPAIIPSRTIRKRAGEQDPRALEHRGEVPVRVSVATVFGRFDTFIAAARCGGYCAANRVFARRSLPRLLGRRTSHDEAQTGW